MSEQLEDFVPENWNRRAESKVKAQSQALVRTLVYVPLGGLVLWLFIHSISGMKKANAEAERDAKLSAELTALN